MRALISVLFLLILAPAAAAEPSPMETSFVGNPLVIINITYDPGPGGGDDGSFMLIVEGRLEPLDECPVEPDQIGQRTADVRQTVESVGVDLAEIAVGGHDGAFHRRVVGHRTKDTGTFGQQSSGGSQHHGVADGAPGGDMGRTGRDATGQVEQGDEVDGGQARCVARDTGGR